MAFLRRLTAGLLALALALLSGCDAVAEPASGGVSLAPSSEEGAGRRRRKPFLRCESPMTRRMV